MTRSNPSELFDLDHEIERTLHFLHRNGRILFEKTDNMDHNMHERTLTELVAPDVNYQALSIQYPKLDADFELKLGLIHLLPKFHGLAGKATKKNLSQFTV